MLAKAVFVLAGYGLYAGLARILTRGDFGTYLVVNSVVSILNALFITGTIQTVARYLAQRQGQEWSVVGSALRLQGVVAGGLCAIFWLTAPGLGRLLNDSSLSPLLRLSAIIPLAYSFYAIFIGYLNGTRRFAAQALFDMTFSGLKLSLVLTLAATAGVTGAIGGFAAAAVLILGLSALFVWPHLRHAAAAPLMPIGRLLGFQATVMAYQGLLNLVMQADLLLIKALLPLHESSIAAAGYGAAVKIAQIPQSLLIALNFLVFPLVAQATSGSDRSTASDYVRRAFQACLVLVAGPAAVLAVTGSGTMALVFGPAYSASGGLMAFLAPGYGALALLGIGLTVLNGSGRPLLSVLLIAGTLVAQVALVGLLVGPLGTLGAAIGTTSAFALGLMMTAVVVRHGFGALLAPATLLRVGLACLACVAVAPLLPRSGPWLPVSDVVLVSVYGAVLLAAGEWRSLHQSLVRPADRAGLPA